MGTRMFYWGQDCVRFPIGSAYVMRSDTRRFLRDRLETR